jgi:DNA-binding IclR family transcriptional regulator
MLLAAVRSSANPMSIAELTGATGSAAITVMRTAQRLVRAGHLIRVTNGKFSYFTLPTSASTEGEK